MVHGFNVNRPNGSAELQNLGRLLTSVADGAAVAVLWPGGSMLGPVCYPFERNKADDTVVELAKFINDNLIEGQQMLGSAIYQRPSAAGNDWILMKIFWAIN